MALVKYYIGNVGGGKSTRMYRDLLQSERESLYNSKSRRSIVIVPEQYAMQAQENLLDVKKESGDETVVLHPKIYSFKRLAFEILDKHSASENTPIDEIAKIMLLRRLMTKREDKEFIVDKRISNILGIKSVLSEFEQYNIRPSDIEEVMSDLEDDSPDYRRLNFLRGIYSEYLSYTKEHDICFDILVPATDLIKEKQLFRNSVVAFDEFNGFTYSQLSFIKELFQQADELIFTLTVPAVSLLKRAGSSYDMRLFFPAIRTYLDLREWFGVSEEEFLLCEKKDEACSDTETVPEVGDKERPNTKSTENSKEICAKNPSSHLDILREYYLRGKKLETKESCENVTLFEPVSVDEEIERVCEEIVYLTGKKGYRYKDIAIVSSDLERYERYFNRMSELYEIPFLLDAKRPIDKHPLSLFLIQALEVVRTDFSDYSVIRLIKNPLFGIEEAEELENRILRLGLRGRKRFESWNEEEMSEAFIGERIVRRLKPLTDVFDTGKKNKKSRLSSVNSALIELLNHCNMQEVFDDLLLTCKKQEREGFIKEAENTLELIYQNLEKMEKLLGEEIVNAEEYKDILTAALSASSIGDIPALYDGVIIKDLMFSRHRRNYRAVFILGMNEGSLPVITNDNGLFTESLRQSFAKKRLSLSDNSEQKIMIQCYELYRSLLTAKERLYLSCPKSDALNEPLKPSYLLTELLDLMEVRQEGEVHRTARLLRGGYTVKTLGHLFSVMQSKETETKWAKALYSFFKESLEKTPEFLEDKSGEKHSKRRDGIKNAVARELDLLETAGKDTVRNHALPEQLARKIYGNKPFSITQMENFAGCHFAHFCRYGLRLRERQIYLPNTMDYGKILHSSMEYAESKIKQLQTSFADLSSEDIEKMSEQALKFAFRQEEGRERNEYLNYHYNKLLRVVRRSLDIQSRQMKQGSFRLHSFEREFSLSLDSERKIKGVIDRIDTFEDMVRVIDYKSGKRELDNSLLYYGLQLQLPLYLKGAMKLVEEERRKQDSSEFAVSPNGMFYYRLSDPLVDLADATESLFGIPLEEKTVSHSRMLQLRLRGRFNPQKEHLVALDNGFDHPEGDSLAGNHHSSIIYANSKKNGELSAISLKNCAIEPTSIMNAAWKNADRITGRILQGEIPVNPAVVGSYHACEYCGFSGVCGMDTGSERIRYLKKVTDEELLILGKPDSLSNSDEWRTK